MNKDFKGSILAVVMLYYKNANFGKFLEIKFLLHEH